MQKYSCGLPWQYGILIEKIKGQEIGCSLSKHRRLEGFFIGRIVTGGIVIKGFVIAGTSSGCGKTTVTLGILASLTRLGFKTAPFKVGPDFIDPGHHTGITGRHSRNLDGWMLSEAFNLETFRKNTQNADIAVVEGVMGLFDGYDGKNYKSSSYSHGKCPKHGKKRSSSCAGF